MKGNIDLVVLVVGVMVMILMILIASFFMSRLKVRAELEAQIDNSEEEYQSLVASAVALRHDESLEAAGEYYFWKKRGENSKAREELQKLKEAGKALGTHTRAYYLDVRGVKAPGGAQKEVTGWMGDTDKMKTVVLEVPSRAKSPVEVEIGVGESS